MKKIYSYDNCEGDKGAIIADSLEEAITLFKKEYPDREIASNTQQYWNNGCYISEIGILSEDNQLYVVCEW